MSAPEAMTARASAGSIPRVMLWSTPRSLSTVFERAILELSNVEVFNEEFSTAYCFGPERSLWMVPTLSPKHTFKWVKESLEADYPGRDGVFGKDFATSIVDRKEMLPDGFYHTFLIRHPRKTFTSVSKVFNTASFYIKYRDMCDLYREVCKMGLPTLIIDADDLLADPVGVLHQYCKLTGLPFKKTMVEWKPTTVGEMDWHCSWSLRFMNYLMGWYDVALQSSGFRKPALCGVDGNMDSLPLSIREKVEENQPYYEELYNQRMIVSS